MFAQGGPGMGLQAPFGGPMGFGMLPPPLHPMAAPGMIPPPPPGMGLMVLPLGELDLSDDQTEKLAALKADAMDKAGPAMLKVHALERQFRSALVQPEISRDQLARVQGQLAAQKQALDAIFSDNLVASAQVLTPEQRQVLRQKMNHDELGPFTFRKKGPAVEHK
jgi:Spy/CpxP family protein refolding chaperone